MLVALAPSNGDALEGNYTRRDAEDPAGTISVNDQAVRSGALDAQGVANN
jgi:hypothetical protein